MHRCPSCRALYPPAFSACPICDPCHGDVTAEATKLAGGIDAFFTARTDEATRPIRVVSPRGKTAYATIAAALRDAQPGTRIEVHPGIYTEALDLSADVEIVGIGWSKEIVLQHPDRTCVLSRAGRAVLRNLTLRHRAKGSTSDCAVVRVTRGSLLLDECSIGPAGAGVEVESAGSIAALRSVHIAEIRESGVMVQRQGRAEIVDCTISRARTGVTVRQGGHVVMRDSTVRDSRNGGLSFYEYGNGTVEDCDIAGSREMGIGIVHGSNPVIRRCTVHDGKKNGIGVLAHGQGLIEDCTISNHGAEGLVINGVGVPMVRRCAIHSGKHYGVAVYSRGQGLIEDCEIYGNAYGGVIVEDEESLPLLRRCRVHDNQSLGVSFANGAEGVLESCSISGTDGPGLYVTQRAAPILSDCVIEAGTDAGCVFTARASGLLDGCMIKANALSGIALDGASDPTIRACTLDANRQAGIAVARGSSGNIEGCDIGGSVDGILVRDGSAPIINACTIHDCLTAGLHFQQHGLGRAEACAITGNIGAGIIIEEESNPAVYRCKVSGNLDAGIWVDTEGRGVLEESTICDNLEPGVRITRGGDPELRRCRIQNGRGGGIVRSDYGRGRMVDCEETDNEPPATAQDVEAVLMRYRERADAAVPEAPALKEDDSNEDDAALVGPTLVFCQCFDEDEYVYDAFLTADDAVLIAAALEVEAGTLSAAEAYKLCPQIEPDDDEEWSYPDDSSYAGFLRTEYASPTLPAPAREQRPSNGGQEDALALEGLDEDDLADPEESNEEWEDVEEDEDEDAAAGPDFPTYDDIMDREYLPGREMFCAIADGLGIPGVGIVREGLSPASGLVFRVKGAGALDELRATLCDRYSIVVMADGNYAGMGTVAKAKHLIAEARRRTDLGY